MSDYDVLKLENQLCFSIYATSRSITKLYKPHLDKLGITYPQYLVMLVLWESNEITLKELGNKLFLDSGTLTPLLKRLEHMGYLRRERSSRDERLLCVTITEEGNKLRENAYDIPISIVSSMNVELDNLIKLKNEVDYLLKRINE